MLTLKNIINRYYMHYVFLIVVIWIGMFFVRWDTTVAGVLLYPLIMKQVFIVLGVVAMIMAIISRKIVLGIFGLLCCAAFWINLFLAFYLLPGLLGN
ncbi:hypothetical protein QLT07_04250 [Streptococcus equi subsp. zooepidemicus]|uniref:hypothetical protein n=1 Tax=Streptococcus equi TaxID=1336 RepID=UPI0024A99A44|nr:hypothetical protein [Streptococcus equi]MDI6043797.1 hypothetical protein [Streptococcus equi subsp. zooepidemicus]HEK9981406.1 hypothetical protein [Streptococcus equi subsp. zooepidemicus]HEL0023472.1 hypothetical protein [Streptococcus equi subsp. zooepidemicus]HEL0195953.1 hypothetical protein [Streptococcus equi subsp. zooepidemicus]HEL0206092.1 hypothetical protein [Streptococcus equi subsp. zooepidemicus]